MCWSLDKLADESGVSRKSVINVENAHNVPLLPTLHGLAHGLGVPLADLVVPLCTRHTRRRLLTDREGANQ